MENNLINLLNGKLKKGEVLNEKTVFSSETFISGRVKRDNNKPYWLVIANCATA